MRFHCDQIACVCAGPYNNEGGTGTENINGGHSVYGRKESKSDVLRYPENQSEFYGSLKREGPLWLPRADLHGA